MATTVHSTLTGADLHEPKGAATALVGEVYVADGAGSGVWSPASSVITNTAFTTGDLKSTHKTTADTSWILWAVGTIGDGSSAASLRANADTAALFKLYWNNFSNTLCPVTGGRGLSAVADYASHKIIALPPGPSQVMGIAGAGTGFTVRSLGATVGTETHALIAAEIPALTSTGSIAVTGSLVAGLQVGSSSTGGGGFAFNTFQNTNIGMTSTGTATVHSSGTSGTAHTIMQPTVFVNVMIKL
jgi:hypothetical protein